MAQDYIEKGFKKMILAGIGAAAITAEKSKELLDQLAQKGELTVAQGKAINEELKHNKRSNLNARSAPCESAHEFGNAWKVKDNDIDTLLDNMTPEQMEELREKILQRDQA